MHFTQRKPTDLIKIHRLLFNITKCCKNIPEPQSSVFFGLSGYLFPLFFEFLLLLIYALNNIPKVILNLFFYPLFHLSKFLLQKKLQNCLRNSAGWLRCCYKELQVYIPHYPFQKMSFALCCFCFSILLSFAAFLLIME